MHEYLNAPKWSGASLVREGADGSRVDSGDGGHYGHLVPGGNRAAVDRLDTAPNGNLSATDAEMRAVMNGDKSFVMSGEPTGIESVCTALLSGDGTVRVRFRNDSLSITSVQVLDRPPQG